VDFLLAIRKDRSLAEVRLQPATQRALTKRFDQLASALRDPALERHPYEPAFTPDADSVLELKSYVLPEGLWSCRRTLPNLPVISEEDLSANTPAAIVAVSVGAKPTFAFQAVGTRSILREQSTIFFNPKGFVLNDDAGISITAKLDALHEDSVLLFRNEQTVRRFLPMDEFFKEATDDDIDEFFDEATFVVDDTDEVRAAATQLQRRKLHRLLKEGVKLTPSVMQRIAKRVGTALTTSAGRIVVPKSRKEFADLVRILHDDFLQSLHGTDIVYLTTSKRPVKKK
jgi:Domain of unknown function (DUF4868)